MTAKEFKCALDAFPDDFEIVVAVSDGYGDEKKGTRRKILRNIIEYQDYHEKKAHVLLVASEDS